ncbi:hypothetical protein IQ243_20410 [Nostocales cyanobacterium LEGE 11386]|nr:hypothetical protein [Nostocales cyanobacterium LEGE 11386]
MQELNSDELLLTFQELRDKCFRHIKEVHTRYSVGYKFTDPDIDWLNQELTNILDSLRNNKAVYNYEDLVNAFYSVISELEYGQILYPNSLIVLGNRLCRILKFLRGYPVQIAYGIFTKQGNGKLKHTSYTTTLKEPVQRVLIIDPLTKNL